MRIAVSATGNTGDCEVEPRFGRSPYFLVFDTASGEFETIVNEGSESAGGAGVKTAKLIIDAGANVVLTGRCGPNAQRTLDSAGVTVKSAVDGIVRDVVKAFCSSTAAD